MKPTINDVAREANVSRGTVDRVLNHKGSVSKNTENKVQEAIKRLNYKRSAVASALAQHKKKIKIGIIYPDVEHFFWKEVNKGIKIAKNNFQSLGVEIIVKTTKTYNYLDQIEAFDYMIENKVNGIVTMSYHQNKTNNKINDLFKLGIPVVTFVSDAPESKRLSYVGLNDYKSGVTAAKLMGLFLKEKGNIAIIGVHRDLTCMVDRVNGFINKINNDYSQINILGTFYITENREEEEKLYRGSISELTREILYKYPNVDAIYSTNSLISCIGKVVSDSKIEKKIIVIGHENTEEIKGLMLKNIIDATVYQNQFEEIIRATNILYGYIIDGELDYSLTGYSEQGILIKEKIE